MKIRNTRFSFFHHVVVLFWRQQDVFAFCDSYYFLFIFADSLVQHQSFGRWGAASVHPELPPTGIYLFIYFLVYWRQTILAPIVLTTWRFKNARSKTAMRCGKNRFKMGFICEWPMISDRCQKYDINNISVSRDNDDLNRFYYIAYYLTTL